MTLFIVGAGGFGRETYDAVLAGGGRPPSDDQHGAPGSGTTYQDEPVVFCDHARAGQEIRGLPVVHPDKADDDFVVAIADTSIRSRLAGALYERGLEARTIVHPRAVVGPDTTVGAGSVVLALAHVSSSCRLGRHVQVNYTASVGHDVLLDDFATVFPGANVAGGVHIGAGATVGSNACVLQGLSVGAHAYVGAGAVVTRDVAPGTTVVGVPARRHGRAQEEEGR